MYLLESDAYLSMNESLVEGEGMVVVELWLEMIEIACIVGVYCEWQFPQYCWERVRDNLFRELKKHPEAGCSEKVLQGIMQQTSTGHFFLNVTLK